MVSTIIFLKNQLKYNCLFFVLILFCACADENFTTDADKQLSFSTTTLSFDTIFSSVPSPTKTFKVYNRNKKALKISSIALEKGADSYFRMNVDGTIPPPENYVQDVILKANDSLYVFVEITAKEQNTNALTFVEDAVVFSTNGQQQKVSLTAHTQDVVIFDKKTINNDTTFTADKPYLIYNYLKIGEGKTLTLQPGTQLYFHQDADLFVGGNLVAEGTFENPILLRGDRLDRINDSAQTPYAYLPGQWGSILLEWETGNHILKNVSISGATNGIFISGGTSVRPKLELENTSIHTCLLYGVYSQNVDMKIVNTEISNCGASCLMIFGGNTSATHCTFANYYEWGGSAEMPAVSISNYKTSGNWSNLMPVYSAVFQNCILAGNQKKELILKQDTISKTNNIFNIYFDHCYIKLEEIKSPDFRDNIFSSKLSSDEKLFKNTSISDIKTTGYYDFTLHTNSLARNNAKQEVSELYSTDKNNYNRFADGKPDIGAYEYH